MLLQKETILRNLKNKTDYNNQQIEHHACRASYSLTLNSFKYNNIQCQIMCHKFKFKTQFSKQANYIRP